MPDQIHIDRLAVSAFIGVPDSERAQPQRLEISLTFPVRTVSEAAEQDDLSLTVNYYDVCETIKRVTAEHPRKLLETLAEDICRAVLEEFAIGNVELEIRKFIIPETRFISLKITR